MNESFANSCNSQVSERVRQNIGSALLAAALLCYFGFFYRDEPTGTDLFSRALYVLYHTLRFGGVAMAIVAVGSMVGHSVFLLADGVVSVAIGTLLVLTGLAMLYDGGDVMQIAINIICGGMFFSAGRRSWADYFILRRSHTTEANQPPATNQAVRTIEANHAGTAPGAPAGQLREASSPGADLGMQTPEVPAVSSLLIEEVQLSPPPPPADPPSARDVPTPDGGFLASFGGDGSPPAT